MTNFIIRRVIQSFILLFFISMLIYMILNIVPGGPFDLLKLSNPRISQSHIDRLNALLDLDKPLLPGNTAPRYPASNSPAASIGAAISAGWPKWSRATGDSPGRCRPARRCWT